jgi:glycosyltransferase involved in cell wall biosynthesis
MISPLMRVAVLTTSYPRDPADIAGRFVADAVARLRAADVEVDVVSPSAFRHFGIAYGSGIPANLRANPLRAALLPAFLASFRRAARNAAHGADLVHAHWLPAGAVAATLGKPYVVQVWGTDVELARRVSWLARPVLRRARVVVAASTELADSVRDLGATDVRVIPGAVDVPDEVAEPEEPPHVLFAGRLSTEKGILELVQAANGLPLVVVGDGPLRERVVGARGFLPHDELLDEYARAAVVACPSRREGFGVVCAEAMAHGRAVVATPVGGMRDLVEDGVTGLVVPTGDVAALREALERLLTDAGLRKRLGDAARERVRQTLSSDKWTDETLRAYRDALA